MRLCHADVIRTWGALFPLRRVSFRPGATLLQASATVFPPKLIAVAAVLGKIAAILLLIPFVVFLALRVVALVVLLRLRDAKPAKGISPRGL